MYQLELDLRLLMQLTLQTSCQVDKRYHKPLNSLGNEMKTKITINIMS